MTKRNNRKYGISRHLGVNLWGRAKDPVNARNYPPGQHGLGGYRKRTDYGEQLFAKQMLKKYYGDITEKKFRSLYKEASRKKGDTSENLIGLLESMLLAVVYRSNFAKTVFEARQMINHGHILVDGARVNISTYSLKAGQVVEVRERSKQLQVVQTSIAAKERSVPEYLEVDTDKLVTKYNRVPILADVPYPVIMKPNLVIEFYSRN